MHREVTRPLILWPAAAATLMIASAWTIRPDGPNTPMYTKSLNFLSGQSRGRTWPIANHLLPAQSPTKRLAAVATNPQRPLATPIESSSPAPAVAAVRETDLELAERSEQGSRAMRIPQRLVASQQTAPPTEQIASLHGQNRTLSQKTVGDATPPDSSPNAFPSLKNVADEEDPPADSLDWEFPWAFEEGPSHEAETSPLGIEAEDGATVPNETQPIRVAERTENPETPGTLSSDSKISGSATVAPTRTDVEANRKNRVPEPSGLSQAMSLFQPNGLPAHEPLASNVSDMSLPEAIDGMLPPKSSPPIDGDRHGFLTEASPVGSGVRRDSILPRSISLLAKRVPKSASQPVPAPPSEIVSAPKAPEPVASMISHRASPLGEPAIETDEAASAPVAGGARAMSEKQPTGWPMTPRLDRRLKDFRSRPAVADKGRTLVTTRPAIDPAMATWAAEVETTLQELRALPRIGDERSGPILTRLGQLAETGLRDAESLSDRQHQIDWLRASHSVSRRLAVWKPVWSIAHEYSGDDNSAVTEPSLAAVGEAVAAVRSDLAETGDAAGWDTYLLLDRLVEMSSSHRLDQRRELCQRFLSRLRWHRLSPEHAQWLDRPSLNRLADAVRPWAQQAVDYVSLLNQIERQESDTVDLSAMDVADAIRGLQFARSDEAVAVADALGKHYRNANVRFAISDRMLQRLLPTIERQSVPVRTQMFGSQIRGVSEIESDLQIRLLPSEAHWNLNLITDGRVRTHSTGHNGPVRVKTHGTSEFLATTPIEVATQGVVIGNTKVDSKGVTRLGGIHSDYDGWPLLGSLVQGLARDRYDSVADASNRRANRQIENRVAKNVDTRLESEVARSTTKLGEILLGPLGKLQLDPQVVDMKTTEQRLLARYRLAGHWQMAAFTPRPRAPRSSLMSLQIHQSALNNTLEQLVPRDEPQSVREIVRQGLVTFGQTDIALPEDLPEDVTVQFAPTRPITIEIEEGEFWVTLRVMRLQRGDRLDLRRFIVRALYRPEIDGLEARLVRDGHLTISGPGMSMRQRLPLRAIFNKILSPNQPWPLTTPALTQHAAAENLAISQLELRDGWIGLAVSETDAPRIAMRGGKGTPRSR